MTPALSPNTQAILLLTAPLIAGRVGTAPELLTPGEYKRLARHLREMQRQPADLLTSDAADLLRSCNPIIDESRLQRLLGRGFLLSQVIERWQSRAIWVVSRADAEYPRRIKTRLREDAPAVLYGCGDITLLEFGGLAVVGSRHVDDQLIDYTMSVGGLAARSGKSVVSGGAKGIDQAAMRGALEAGGKVCGVLADSLEKTAMNREHRNLLIDGQMVLISPYDPNAGFNVGNAMQRNKLIYALADASLVVSSDLNKGGTWAGATEQLDKLRFVPVFVRTNGEHQPGLKALLDKGALSWPNPQDKESFGEVFNVAISLAPSEAQVGLSLFSSDSSPDLLQETKIIPNTDLTIEPDNEATLIDAAVSENISMENAVDDSTLVKLDSQNISTDKKVQLELIPSEALFLAVREIIHNTLTKHMKESEVAEALNVSNPQARVWLQRLESEGFIEKDKKLGYLNKQNDLFD